MKSLNITKDQVTPNQARNQISYLKNKMIMPEAQSRKQGLLLRKKLVEIYSTYQKALRDNDALDFDDLLLLPIELFDQNPKILAKYQRKWKYILVDEYQDTNRPQFYLLTMLAKRMNRYVLLEMMINQSTVGGVQMLQIFLILRNFSQL